MKYFTISSHSLIVIEIFHTTNTNYITFSLIAYLTLFFNSHDDSIIFITV